MFGKTYGVYVQADARFRQRAENIGEFKTRNTAGDMVPICSVVSVLPAFGPVPVIRYNGYPAADLASGPDPSQMSSSQALVKVAAIAQRVLTNGMTFE